MEYVEVDGSLGEGGGQILRTAVAFSAILSKPVRVKKIRGGRGVPGLKRQHVSALTVLAQVFGGELGGASEGSSEITFVPGDTRVGSLTMDMGTAASITLVLQAVVPAVALSRRSLRLELTGGTDVPWSPTFDHFSTVVRGAYGLMGIVFDARSGRRGYYPRGGGKVVATVEPCASLKPLTMEGRGKVIEANVVSRCGSLPRHVAERQLSAASAELRRAGIEPVASIINVETSDSPGSSILLHYTGPKTVIGTDGIGARGMPAEEVGRGAAARFLAEAGSGACLDSNLADMVIPLLAVADSPSIVKVREVTSHLKSGMEIAKQFTSCRWTAEASAGATLVSVVPG